MNPSQPPTQPQPQQPVAPPAPQTPVQPAAPAPVAVAPQPMYSANEASIMQGGGAWDAPTATGFQEKFGLVAFGLSMLSLLLYVVMTFATSLSATGTATMYIWLGVFIVLSGISLTLAILYQRLQEKLSLFAQISTIISLIILTITLGSLISIIDMELETKAYKDQYRSSSGSSY